MSASTLSIIPAEGFRTYICGAPNKINLYVGKKAVKFNIPEAEAVDRLVDLIKEHNKWVEPEAREEAAAA